MAYEIPTYMEYFHFEPLGYVQARGGERRYVFRTHTDIIIYRAVVLASLGGLLGLNPDVGLWRKLFPKGGRTHRYRSCCRLLDSRMPNYWPDRAPPGAHAAPRWATEERG